MASYQNVRDDVGCESAGRKVFIGNIRLSALDAPDTGVANPATSVLQIDVISVPGSETCQFHFVTLEMHIEAPVGAQFVAHSQRNNYHREVLADPSSAITPNPDLVYWVESEAPATTLRIRDDETALLSGPGNGRTYYVGISGLSPDVDALRFTAMAAGSLVRDNTCHLQVSNLRDGDSIPGYLDQDQG